MDRFNVAYRKKNKHCSWWKIPILDSLDFEKSGEILDRNHYNLKVAAILGMISL